MSQHNAHAQHWCGRAAGAHQMAHRSGAGIYPGPDRAGDALGDHRAGNIDDRPAAVGWFQDVLPHEHHAPVPVSTHELTIDHAYAAIGARQPASAARHEVHPVASYNSFLTAGISGGLAGGVAMTVPAVLYGVIKYHSVWYAINLLAAGGFTSWAGRKQ